MRKSIYADVEKHAAQSPWMEEKGRLCAIVGVKFQARKGDAVYDIDTFGPSEDPDLAFELQDLASLGMQRVRYLRRKKRVLALEQEQQMEVKLALGRIADQVRSLFDQLGPLGIEVWMQKPEGPDSDAPPPEHWAGSDPTTTPPH